MNIFKVFKLTNSKPLEPIEFKEIRVSAKFCQELFIINNFVTVVVDYESGHLVYL